MISSEVQRTLVKSAPELWAELSDPAALARHLGELGDIRITRVHPEEKVEWEAADTSGSVAIKPSGWGTRVTLTVTREVAPPQPPIAEQPEPMPEAEQTPEIEAQPELERPAEPGPDIEAQPAPQIWVSPEFPNDPAGEPAIAEEPATPDASSSLAPRSASHRRTRCEPEPRAGRRKP